MKSWKQYRSELLNEEAKQSSDQSAIEDFVGYIKTLAKKYNRQPLLRVWDALTSSKGDTLVRELIKSPTSTVSDFRKLVKS